MDEAGVAPDKNRLPWLVEYKEPASRKSSVDRIAIAGAIAVALVAGSTWFSLRGVAPVSQPAADAVVALPVPPKPAEIVAAAPEEAPVVPVPEALKRPETRRPMVASVPRRPALPPARRIRTANADRKAFDQVARAQIVSVSPQPTALEKAASAVAAVPGVSETELSAPTSRPSINPSAHVARRQTVRMGVYLTQKQADIAWRSAVSDYTYLVTLPKQVSAVSLRGRRFYQLNLGTPSRTHALQLCRNLKSIGYSCTVA